MSVWTMHCAPRIVMAICSLGIVSCAEPQDPLVGPLVGHWIEVDSPNRHLVLNADGSFSNFGGSGFDYWRTEGTFEVTGTMLRFTPLRFVSRSGAQSTEIIIEPYPYGAVFENCEFALASGLLVLHYTTYPADAPVPTTMQLERR